MPLRSLDFRSDDKLLELWPPEQTKFVDGELMLEGSTDDGEPLSMPRQRFTLEEKLKLLDYHPLLTGWCPNARCLSV